MRASRRLSLDPASSRAVLLCQTPILLYLRAIRFRGQVDATGPPDGWPASASVDTVAKEPRQRPRRAQPAAGRCDVTPPTASLTTAGFNSQEVFRINPEQPPQVEYGSPSCGPPCWCWRSR